MLWVAVMVVTFVGLSLGDCAPDEPGHSQCEARRTRTQEMVVGIELAILVGLGWFFYRREMKDDEF
jgi:hypothetical protein